MKMIIIYTKYWSLIFCFFLLTSCARSPIAKKGDGGDIYVGSPVIHTRESLIQDRNREVEWLKQKLKENVAFGYQGLSLSRELDSFSANVKVQLDPTQIAVYKKQQELTVNDLARKDELGMEVASFEKAYYQNQTNAVPFADDLKKDLTLKLQDETTRLCDSSKDEYSQEKCTTALGNYQTAIGSLYAKPTPDESGKKETNENPYKAKSGPNLPASSTDATAFNQEIATLTKAVKGLQEAMATGVGSDPFKSGEESLSVTPINQFIDELAYRQRIRDQISLTRLDDTHDSFGYTLYKLQFDVTILPYENVNAWAKIGVEIAGNKDDDIGFDAILSRYQTIFGNTLSRIDAGLVDDSLSNADLAFLTEKENYMISDNYQILSKQSQSQMRFEDLEVNIPQNDKSEIYKALRSERKSEENAEKFYSKVLNILNFEHTIKGIFEVVPERGYPQLKFSQLGKEKLRNQLEAKSGIAVYEVTPRESTQRIKDIAEFQKLRSLGGSASALIGNVGLEAMVQKVSARERLIHTILRKPVVLGYSNKYSNNSGIKEDFGWIVGPIYKINENRKDADFWHVETQKTVSALISLPAWWNEINLTVKRDWIHPDKLNSVAEKVATYTLQLPAHLGNIGYPLARLGGNIPRVDPKLKAENSIGTSMANVLIKGEFLWRDPVVTIGSVSSSSIQILPDMRGIIASFHDLSGLCKNNKKSCEQNVRVWTSVGNVDAGKITVNTNYTVPEEPVVYVFEEVEAIPELKIGKLSLLTMKLDKQFIKECKSIEIGKVGVWVNNLMISSANNISFDVAADPQKISVQTAALGQAAYGSSSTNTSSVYANLTVACGVKKTTGNVKVFAKDKPNPAANN